MASDQRFYVLRDDFGGPYDTAFEKPDDSESADAPLCPKCGSAIGLRVWLPPYRVEVVVHGKVGPGDLVMGTGTDFLVSERFADAFRTEGLRGLTFDPSRWSRCDRVQRKAGSRRTSEQRPGLGPA